MVMNYDGLYARLSAAGFAHWVDQLCQQQPDWLIHHGDYARWHQALLDLPTIEAVQGRFDQAAITLTGHCDRPGQLQVALKQLAPWRKGPYQIADIYIDAEWRSDYKWSRVYPHLQSLLGKRILDIGCGNGYHSWRMLAEQPELVLGVEPSVLFNLQFQTIQHYLNHPDIYLLPLPMAAPPKEMNWFDTVFSMGVFYHRKSPIEHLLMLKSLLVPGGELCLETLVIEGGRGDVLLPVDRYARMRNVWFIPSAVELASWLERCGFSSIRIVDQSITTTQEQRSTAWMSFESLADCLDAKNRRLTVERLPAPRRAVLLANKPERS